MSGNRRVLFIPIAPAFSVSNIAKIAFILKSSNVMFGIGTNFRDKRKSN